jgi:hypothetical protein
MLFDFSFLLVRVWTFLGDYASVESTSLKIDSSG